MKSIFFTVVGILNDIVVNTLTYDNNANDDFKEDYNNIDKYIYNLSDDELENKLNKTKYHYYNIADNSRYTCEKLLIQYCKDFKIYPKNL